MDIVVTAKDKRRVQRERMALWTPARARHVAEEILIFAQKEAAVRRHRYARGSLRSEGFQGMRHGEANCPIGSYCRGW